MLEDVKQRLASFGYSASAADDWMLNFCIQKVETHIKNSCNVAEVPAGLRPVAIDRACGEFLFGKKQSGQGVDIDFEAAVKSIAEGDTTITFDSSASAESKYDALISYLMHSGADFSAYRCIKW